MISVASAGSAGVVVQSLPKPSLIVKPVTPSAMSGAVRDVVAAKIMDKP